MRRERFHRLVADALDDIPEPFARHLADVQVVVEDEPRPDVLTEMGLDPRRDTLFGLYEGVPIGERDETPLRLPDRITIFYRPIVRTFRSPAAIRREVRKTVIHEVAHFFGLDESQVEAEDYA